MRTHEQLDGSCVGKISHHGEGVIRKGLTLKVEGTQVKDIVEGNPLASRSTNEGLQEEIKLVSSKNGIDIRRRYYIACQRESRRRFDYIKEQQRGTQKEGGKRR